MNDLFREQLLKAGLATKKQVKAAAHEQNVSRRKKRRKGAEAGEESDVAEAARAAAAEKQARDKALNRQREETRAAQAKIAEADALIADNLLRQTGGDVPYKFPDGAKVKTLYVSSEVQRALASGNHGIVRTREGYGLVSRATALAIEERCAERLVLLNEPDDPKDEDDPYGDYVVPDDLMW